MPESYSVLSNVAARTSTIELGVLATSVLYRQPTMLAKIVTTLDVLSGGRAILGIGAGHPRTEHEHRAYGYDFPNVATRMTRLEDALLTLRAMLGPPAESDAPPNWPRPTATIPILVAGSGEQRLLRIAARHADMVNLSFPSGDSLDRLPHKLDVLSRHCQSVGRDRAEIAVTYKAVASVGTARDDASHTAERWCTARGLPILPPQAGIFVGEPDDIAAQARPFLDAGVDHLIVELAGGADAKSIALAADALGALA
jgi:alkanesulfonate monooxygenase SsuD/methylene tetrahydromethanopterin reductase-like flavin-dependent oxidoreductase (luciferase family)